MKNYKPAEKFIIVNDNDPDLNPIKLPLPKPPPKEEIDGYGKDPRNQKFIPPKLPKRLNTLNRRMISLIDKITTIEDTPEDWRHEIEFIQREWGRRKNGYWFYNNGVPTYITGTHYLYCAYWKIDVGLPEYRDRDRKFFLFSQFCENDPNSFGFVYPKHRREGATHKAGVWNYDGVSQKRRVRGGIQSMTEQHAKTVFQKHIVPGWRYLPFFFQPIYEGSTNPKRELSFNAPAIRVTATNMGERVIDALGSSIDFGSSDKGFYDGSKLYRYHVDEAGKCLSRDTAILMHDGSRKMSQDIESGDVIMGVDSKPRIVLSTTTGREKMYEVIPTKGDPWGCNESHILSLRWSSKVIKGTEKGGIYNIPVKEYLEHTQCAQNHLKLWRTDVDYPAKEHDLEPYMLGVWLGDGTHNDLRDTNVYGNKHIPNEYLIDSRANRLELLAGLIDSDGYLSKKKGNASGYEIIQKRKELAENIHILANSLGFYSSIRKKLAKMKRSDGTIYECDVYRVKIYGDLYKIPCKVKRKIAHKFEYHVNRRNPLRVGFKLVDKGIGDYYGFTLDGDGLFLLGDYTVTHNTTDVDVYERWMVTKQTLATGARIVGQAIITSTAGEMKRGGGQLFKDLCDASNYHKKDANNQTRSGLYRLFVPATEGLEGFVDEFGNSSKREAQQYLDNRKDAAIEAGDFKALSEITRQFPTLYRECFRGENDACNFNRKILEERLDHFAVGKNKYLTEGDFVWVDNIVDGRVKFVPREGGKFKVSWLYDDPSHSNMFMYSSGVKIPGNTTKFSAGGDPFKFKTTIGGRKSNGAGAVFMMHDSSIDMPTTDISEWTTNRFVCTYSYRPSDKQEYGEDMLMMCMYYGCYMFPEVNVPFLWDYFTERGYGGYLFYDVDKKTNKYKKTPGITTTQEVREDIFREYHTYIQNHGMREVHDELLRECLEIEDDMGDFDLFTAGGYALLGARKGSFASLESENNSVDLNDYYTKYTI